MYFVVLQLAAALSLVALTSPARVSAEERSDLPTALVYHPDYLLHDPGRGHPERSERLQAIMGHLQSTGRLDDLVRIEPEPVEERWLETVHTAAYLKRVRDAVASAPYAFDADTSVSAASYRVARLATGGMLSAIDAVMDARARNAFVAARPPGHHALPDRAMGFCIVNHVAVAARYAQKRHAIERILIVDWDVHHGNGTQEIFYADPTVLYFSVHQAPYYPGTGSADETGAGAGMGTTLNVPLPSGTGDDAIIRAFEEKLEPAADAFKPQFVLITAGFDAHLDDPLAGFELTEAGYRAMTRIVMNIAARHANGRIVSLLEGGYALDALARSVAAHLDVLATHDASGPAVPKP
ncbi:MAG: histone deacetylase family protein [Gammaproteobacteria bacterium]